MAETLAQHIPLEPVQSSNIAAVGFDQPKGLLAVQFKTGHIYHYAGVSETDYAQLVDAPSKGKHFGTHIRSKFQGEKMTGSCSSCGNAPGWIGETCDSCGCASYAPDPRKGQAGA